MENLNSKTYVLKQLPSTLRKELFNAYNEIVRNYKENRWEPSELNGGKLCEIIYTIIRGHVNGNIPSKASKPPNMVDACRKMEQASGFPRSIRIQIPRMIIALYEIRNNRGVGHTGGDVNPNNMDATAVLYMSKWLMAELIRIFHSIDLSAASMEVNKIVERIIPFLWEFNGKIRVLDTNLNMKQKTLAILYKHSEPVPERDLVKWLEHSNASVYRRDVLKKLHKDKLIEYDKIVRTAMISPKGIAFTEKNIIERGV